MNGLSATFSSSADPGGFIVYPSFFETLTGNVLGDPGTSGQDNLTLDVNFSQALTALTLDFATSDFFNPSPMTLVAYDNGVQVGTASSTGEFLPGFIFPEGELSFDGANFNSIALSSTATDFAVDNIAVLPAAATPEPSGLVLLGSGLLMLGFLVKKSKSIRLLLGTASVVAIALLPLTTPASAQVTQSIFPFLPPTVSTVPSKGDVNPYGVAFGPSNMPRTGVLQPGDILVSNFNDSLIFKELGPPSCVWTRLEMSPPSSPPQ